MCIYKTYFIYIEDKYTAAGFMYNYAISDGYMYD